MGRVRGTRTARLTLNAIPSNTTTGESLSINVKVRASITIRLGISVGLDSGSVKLLMLG